MDHRNKRPKQSKKNLVIGIKPMIEALEQGLSIFKVFIQRDSDNLKLKEVAQLCKDLDIPFQKAPIEKLNRLSMKNHQGVIGFLAPVPFIPFEEIVQRTFEEGRDPKLLLLDEVSDVRNFGSICRSALAFGIDAVIVPFKGAASISDDAVKTSAGAIMNLHICRVSDLAFCIRQLEDFGIPTYGLSEKSTQSMHEVKSEGPMALVMGNEEVGLSSRVQKCCKELLRIQMDHERFDSLNVSVAAGIALHHFFNPNPS